MLWNFENVLLIGGSGFVGGWIASCLSERGVRVTIATRHRENTKKLIMLPTVSMVEANVHDPQALVKLMQRQDAVINLVGILHDSDSRLPYGKGFAAAHVDLPRKIIAAMRESGVRRLVHMSALRAAIDAPSEYLRSKGEGEALVRAAMSELEITVFRPSVIFGPDDAFLNMFAKLIKLFPLLPLGGGAARFQPVYVGDVASAFADCLSNGATFGKTYELCGPKVYTLRELVEYTARLVGRKPEDHRPRHRRLGLPAGRSDVAAAEAAAVSRQPALDAGRQRHRRLAQLSRLAAEGLEAIAPDLSLGH
jgi:uncharacterized protein YbjT (DUF2867 family)